MTMAKTPAVCLALFGLLTIFGPSQAAPNGGATSACLCPRPSCPARAARHGLATSDPVKEGIDKNALSKLIEQATVEKSSALVILKNGKLVYENYFGKEAKPIVTMSVSKSIAALAVGILIAQKKLALSDKVSRWIKPWRKDDRDAITIAHLLSHTSGLSSGRAHKKWGRLRWHAKRSKLVHPPGERFRYNNNAVDMLALVVRGVSGMFLDDFLQRYLFGPLEIAGAHWLKYRDGNVRLAGELFIRPVDLARVGQMLLDGGRYRGKQIIARAWIKQMIKAAQPHYAECGLLWWREAVFMARLEQRQLDLWAKEKVPAETIAAAKPLLGKLFREEKAFFYALEKALGKPAYKALRKRAYKRYLPLYGQVRKGAQLGYSARGWMGQFLVVLPKKRLVAVRMRKLERADYRRGRAKYHFPDFRKMVRALVK
jgi:CubicO group peptidase (beta-lactamase class C family)